ncbi:nitrogenase iron-molybdenum cofactor biosynthesis protein NifE [Mesorhizobium delmotii]|uniref:Nitrogenase iron-molybdenum cofactor biosynthesis protein NifE n=1 Tax=Mesorhizobium delmotii TaxID=1631247 RepID=A0A2P9AT04_9HYPH|nr:nitrogenase iron-molybdenum cofactor biosynthesis protein NifE [Mesorhizobium delmotii]SJM34299.1 Nitrogenase iron-molybdenum cofactor biosynthesis protein NifE [Mesorhizobium delmotii]
MTSLSAKIQDVFDEPACDKNRGKNAKARKEGCAKLLTPGAAAGGCAFDGAKIVLQPITDVAHLVHAPLACEGNSWDNRGAASSGPTLWRTSFTTDLTELDVVMGQGERKLFKAIREIKEAYAPPAVFVYSTCVTALIGDDIEAVCKRAAEKFGLAVVPINAPGLVGSKNLGNKLAAEALLDHVIGTVEPDDAGPYDINILGEFNLSGEFWLIKPLLDRLGIRVRACIPGDARYLDVASAHRARAAMVVCSTALINLARKMDERWDIPFFEGSFYGISDTSEALRNIAELLVRKGADPEILDRTETLIAEQEAGASKKLKAYRRRLQGKRVLLNTGGVKSWSVVHALMEIGMEIVGTSVKKSTVEDKERIKQILKDDNHMFEQMAARDLYAMLSEGKADIMLSGGRTQFVALKAKTPWLDINQERQHPYAGYDGMVELVRQIDLAIHNPIWSQVRERAPWDCQPGVKDEQPSTKNETATVHAAQEFAGTTPTISASVEKIR